MNKTKISNISKYFIRISRERVEKSLRYSYRGRWNKKHEMIHHWIEQINTGSRQHKKQLSHMDTSGGALCADTLDNLQSLLKRLKMEPSFEPSMVPNHALTAVASTIMKNEAVGEPIKHDLSGDLPNQENSKLKKEELVESSELALKSRKQKVEGLSLIELFTPEQVKEHIRSLRQSVGQSKDEAEKNQAVENSTSEKFCHLCASSEKLTSEPPHIYCNPCEIRIKKNEMYFTVRDGGTPRYFCIPCYDKFEGDTVCAEGTSIPKEKLEKEKNDEGPEERWVQCDKCEAWQHDICALYNWTRNDEEQGEYICPMCYINEVEQNERKPLPQSAILGAKDLPRTILSDHIEQRLFKRMKQERIERAKLQGYDEIPGAESLVVRVVSSVDKKVEVKSGFREFFREDNFPTEFPYKSKKIEGVDVLLLALYVQEFGSECPFPNQRCVYLAYLDSVKYFRPDIKSAYGEALRTFVYQEILISYLEYCKLRGFTSCYLWSCPPHKGVDYILYSHPEIQKTPNTKKLREWHLAWLRKAAKEEIAVKITNLYDHFVVQTGECKAKVTAARLPYFDGDYWPRKAEVIIQEINQDDDLSDVSQTASKDQLFMHKLRQYIYPIQEDFIVVHLQHCCKHCCTVMVTGNRWVCRQCKNFQLCDGCYDAEQKREDIERHPVNHKDNHDFYLVEIDDIPVDTKDRDEVLESGDFEAPYKFVSFCEKTDIRYDTLRQTKYSSMMLLDLLHLYFKRNCDACGFDIDNNQGYHCKGCNYDLCNACYNKEGTVNHPHKLTNLSAWNKEAK